MGLHFDEEALLRKVKSLCTKGRESGLWAGSVIVAGDREKELFRYVEGIADPASGRRMTYETIFDMASVTKVMGTATLLAIAHERRLLDIDAPLKKFLPEFTGKTYGEPTIRDFSMHTAGMGIWYPHFLNDQKRMKEDILRLDAECERNTLFKYSCLNFLLLSFLLRKVLGRDLADAAKELIFDKLGMKDTLWCDSPDKSRTIRSINADPGTISDFGALDMYPVAVGNAGIFSSPEDVGRFARCMLEYGKGIMKKETAEKLLFTSSSVPAIGRRHAVGWDMGSEMLPEGFSSRGVFHSGWTGQTLWIDPGTGVYMAVLTNRMGDHTEAKLMRRDIGFAVAAAFLGK
ncbi:MAG: beta-lactamase family protein [Lentisphaeria bacterium]|nr:beta-lactamase family protein [Lentisphaeria bacterium]